MWSLYEAKNRLSAVVEAAVAGVPQRISRRGKPAVVILSVADYESLVAEAGGHRQSFADHLRAFPGLAPETEGEPEPEPERAQVVPRDVDL